MAQTHFVRLVFAFLAMVAMAIAQATKPSEGLEQASSAKAPASLTAEQRAQAYKILFQIRDAAARALVLREQVKQADEQEKAKQDEFAALHKQLSGESGCRLDQELEWQCGQSK